jgi:DNA-binding MarR family transcriptional regulator
MLRLDRSISCRRRISTINRTERTTLVDEVVARYEELMHRMAEGHAPEFLEIAITMPQAKLLYLLGAAGELHMSELVARLGVSLSTVSGLVERIVEAGLARRHDDPGDRRQVVVGLTPAGSAFIDRFRELNTRQMRELVDLLDESELDSAHTALAALANAADRLANRRRGAMPDGPQTPTTVREDPA